MTVSLAGRRFKAAVDWWAGLPGNVQGAVLVAAAGLMLVVMSALVKSLGRSLSSFQIVFFRCLIGFILIFSWQAGSGFKHLKTKRPFMHMVRSLVGITAMSSMFYAVTHMPLADATAIGFTRPLWMILLAALLLGEKPSWRRIMATAVGFAGILVMTRPGSPGFQPAALVAAMGALFAGLVVIAIKRLAVTESTWSIMFYYTMWTSIFSFVPALLVWQTPTLKQLALLVVVGIIGFAGQATITRGFHLGEATVVVPFDYLRLVYAGILGLGFFGEAPGLWTATGSALVLAANIYLLFARSCRKNEARE